MALIVTKTPEEIAQVRAVSSISRAIQAQRRAIQDIARQVNDAEEVIAVEYVPASEGVEEVQAVEGKTKLQVYISSLGDLAEDIQNAVAQMVTTVNAASEEQITNPLV